MRLLITIFLSILTSSVFAQAPRGPQQVPVEAARATVGALAERVTGVGSLASNESVILRSEIAGRIVEIAFQEGQSVKKGDLLIRLDDSIYRAELAETEARLELAKRNFARTEELYSNQIATGRSRDEARSNLDVGTAAVELAKVRLAKTEITAPFEGITGLRQVSVGDYITVGQDMFNLEDIDPIKVDFRISERYLPAIRVGQRIQIAVDAYSGRSFDGEVYAIDPRIDEAGRSIVIRARVNNKENLLRPGLFARVDLVLELKPDALTVAEQAIVPRGAGQFVYRIEDGKAKEVEVKLGTRRGGRVEILDGLKLDDVVVTAGHQKIRDGASVTVIESAPSPSQSGPTASAGKGA